jgi:putative intracellular protease/amidase
VTGVGSAPDRPGGSGAATVCILAYDGVDDLDLIGAYGPLRKAAECPVHDGIGSVLLVGDGPTVRTSGGLVLGPVGSPARLADCGAVIAPGGRGVRRAARSGLFAEGLRRAARRGAFIGSICTGAVLVLEAGIVPDRVAIHHAKQALVGGRAGPAAGVGMIRDPRVTSVGGRTGRSVKSVDLAFEAVRRLSPGCVDCLTARLETTPADL